MRVRLSDVLVMAGVCLLYVVTGKLGLRLAFFNPSATAVWVPTGIALAAILLFGRHVWPAIFVGAFAVNITTTPSIGTSLGIAAGNTLEAVLGAHLVNRLGGGARLFDRPQDVFRFAVLAGLCATMASATIGVVSLVAGGYARIEDWLTVWLTWWLGDAAGALIAAPVLLLWSRNPRPVRGVQLLEGALLIGAVMVAGLVMFGGLGPSPMRNYPLTFLALPPLMWAVFRFGPREAATVVALLAAMAIAGTLQGYGAFALLPPNEALVLLQAFMGTIAVMGLPVAALVGERRRVAEEREALRKVAEEERARLEAADEARSRLYAQAAAARRAAEAAHARAACLSDASHILAASLDYETTLRSFARFAVPRIADWCAIDLVAASGAIERLALVHAGAGRDAPAADALPRHPLEIGGPQGVPTVVRTGEPLFRADVSEAALAELLRSDERGLASRLGPGSLIIVPLAAQGRVLGAMTTMTGGSGRRYAEEDVAFMLQVADRAATSVAHAMLYQEAQRTNRAKDEFLAMLGHELRNPLGAIASAVHILERLGVPEPRAVHAREVIDRQAGHLTRLVDDLLDVGRVMTGKIVLDREILDLAETVRRHVDTLRETGRVERHRMIVEAAGVVLVEGDRVRMEQVIGNVTGNALRYTPDGGTIRLQVTREGREAVVRVEDDGVGISAELLPHVFDLFVQGGRPLDRGQGGLGIGLTLARRLVDEHGGRIEVHSEGPGRGSRFTIRLPLAAAPRVEAPREPPQSPPAAARRILVVEDNLDAREALSHLLELDGHEVRQVADGPGAVEEALRWQPDLALIDIGLPGIDGYEVVRRIRIEPTGRRIMLVALTGYGLPEDRQRAREAGFDLHLVKPIDSAKLAEILAMRDRDGGRTS